MMPEQHVGQLGLGSVASCCMEDFLSSKKPAHKSYVRPSILY